jgi:hypothetical protein
LSTSARRLRGGLALALALSFGAGALVIVEAPAAEAAAPAVTTAHPRILQNAAGFARIQQQIAAKDPATLNLVTSVKAEADSYLTAPVPTSAKVGGKSILTASQNTLKHVLALAMMEKISSSASTKAQYKARLWKDLDAVTRFADWNPDEYLDTAEMTTAVSIGYDWLYSEWTSAQRTQMVNAIALKGLKPSLAVYASTSDTRSPYKYGGNWSKSSDNWNVVVNSGMTIGALAVYDTAPSVAKPVLADALTSIQRGVATYANGGGWPEGLGYWEYATRYFTMFAQSLKSATGSDQGFLSKPGIAQAGYFPLYMSSPSGGTTFGFADSASAPYLSSAVGALGTLLKDPVLATAGEVPNVYGSNVQRLLSVDSSIPAATPTSARLALDRVFANAGATTFRSSWTDPNATFLGFRSSNTPKSGHQDLDAGSFSLGALGQTWAEELGKDDYGLSGYMESGVNGARWNYYRARAEGQNTLVIDPADPDSISTTAQTPATPFSSSGANGQSVSDLSALYPSDVTSWRRGVKTTLGGTETIVQDEVTAAKPVAATWTMHTRADVRLSTDGRTAYLYLGGREMAARITSGTGASTFAIAPSTPAPTSPAPVQTANTGVTTLQIPFTVRDSTRLTVEFTPVIDPAATLPAALPVSALADWSPDGSAAGTTAPVAAAAAPAAPTHLATATLTAAPTTMTIGTASVIRGTATDTRGAALAATASYVSSDPTVVSVSSTGALRAGKPGSARIGIVYRADGYLAWVGKTVTVSDPYAIRAVTDGDTYAQAGTTAKKAFGSSTMLAIKPHRKGVAASELTRTAFIHFSIPTVKGHKVSSAIISVRGKVSDGNGTSVRLDAHAVSAGWSEKTLTWANQPALGGRIASATFTSTQAVQKFDVTKYVNSASFTGKLTIGITEDAPAGGQPLLAVLTSRESPTPAVIDVQLAH